MRSAMQRGAMSGRSRSHACMRVVDELGEQLRVAPAKAGAGGSDQQHACMGSVSGQPSMEIFGVNNTNKKGNL